MTVNRLHGLYAVKCGATLIGGITKRSGRTNSDVRQEATSGDVYARFQALYSVKPMFEFSTKSVAAALDNIGLAGEQITAGNTLVFYCQKQQKGGSRESGSVHRTITVNEGLIIPRRITCEHQGDATIDYEVLPIFDGTNEPWVVADTAALGTNPGDLERFTIGRFTLADAVPSTYIVPQIRRLDIDLGIQAETVGADSDVYDTHVRIVEILPSLSLTGIDIEWFKTGNILHSGRKIVHASTEIILRKRAAGSTFVSAATAQHIGFTAAGLAVIDQLFDASGNGLDECSLRLPLQYDGTNSPLTVDTTFSYTP
jgi:hypothetical protein